MEQNSKMSCLKFNLGQLANQMEVYICGGLHCSINNIRIACYNIQYITAQITSIFLQKFYSWWFYSKVFFFLPLITYKYVLLLLLNWVCRMIWMCPHYGSLNLFWRLFLMFPKSVKIGNINRCFNNTVVKTTMYTYQQH